MDLGRRLSRITSSFRTHLPVSGCRVLQGQCALYMSSSTTTTIVATTSTTATPTIAPIRTTLKFDVDFSEIEGREQQFLDECSQKLGITCVGVRPGSIILEVEGDVSQTEHALEELDNGLSLDGFPAFPSPEIVTPKPSFIPSLAPSKKKKYRLRGRSSETAKAHRG
eukprot:TRINITY_DN1183_c0_g1_i2.p2 TRINITY_DN1183_c0_g1~~TRINITY_DN1183_c0_g1_i2.p2  ORF type:complete len:167 (+),score=42.32 TRINITY_DN1183_c0_g1_i2:523-1023(+)